jgi:hypothetical protein
LDRGWLFSIGIRLSFDEKKGKFRGRSRWFQRRMAQMYRTGADTTKYFTE